MENFTKIKGLVALVSVLFFFTSCDKAQEPAPYLQAVVSSNAATAPVPCVSENYALDANGVGAYQLPAPRSVNMTTLITGLSYQLPMTQTKYIITPNGKELSVWQGVDFIQIPLNNKITFLSTAWSECNKGYESKCVRYTDGRVVLSLTTDQAVLPFAN